MRAPLLLFLALLFTACGTTEDVGDAAGDAAGSVSDVADDVPAATADAAEAAVDVAGDGVDAAGDGIAMGADAIADVATAAYDEARGALGADGVADDARVAVAQISAPGDTTTSVRGTASFVETAGGLRVRYDVSGLAAGAHGFHVHEGSSCGAADADGDGALEAGGAAGAHFNPGNNDHGALDDPMSERHAGDLGNIDPQGGTARGTKTTEALALDGDRSVVGRTVVVHADPDEFADAGAMAGGRVGCGVIRLAERDM